MQFSVLPQNVTVNKTNPIVMSCDASGFPTPSLTWTKNGQVVSQLKQLKIQNSDKSEAGMYMCTASNGVGQDKRAEAYVAVQCKYTSCHITVLYRLRQTRLANTEIESWQSNVQNPITHP